MPIQFPARDLTNQYISLSYQDVVQRYDNGSSQYFLDGNGYSIGVIPSASLGNIILTSDQTASYSLFALSALSASYSVTASHAESATIASVADVAFLADTASVSALADFATSASWASQSLSSSWAQTSSYSIFSIVQITQSFSTTAGVATQSFFSTQSAFATQSIFATQSLFATQSISASWAPVEPNYSASVSVQFGTKQDTLIVGGTYPITASWAINAINGGTQLVTGSTYPITSSWANNSINSNNAQTATTASFAVTSSYLIYPSVTLTAASASTISLISVSNNIYNSIFVAYTLNDLQNFRAGNIVVLYNTQSAVLAEHSTTDLGDSSGLTFSASLSASNVNLLAINGSGRDFSVKYHFDVL